MGRGAIITHLNAATAIADATDNDNIQNAASEFTIESCVVELSQNRF